MQLGGFFLVVELARVGSDTNIANPSSLTTRFLPATAVKNKLMLSHLFF